MAIEKIVVVDDELMIRKALETQLRNKRYSVASAGNLKSARKILARDSFDLVFLDFDKNSSTNSSPDTMFGFQLKES